MQRRVEGKAGEVIMQALLGIRIYRNAMSG